MESVQAGKDFAASVMETLLTSDKVHSELSSQGFTAFRLARDGASESDQSARQCYSYSGGSQIAEELERLYKTSCTAANGSPQQLMQRNVTQFGKGRFFSKPFIYEYDLHHAQASMLQPAASACLEECRNWLALSNCALCDHLGLGKDNNDAVSIKLQYNEGGGCFPIHYDNPGGSSKRALTVLCYLNHNWNDDAKIGNSDGGELVLLPFLSAHSYAFAPTLGTCVAFRSDLVLHYTRPSFNKPRMLMTIWIDGNRVNMKEDMQISVKRK